MQSINTLGDFVLMATKIIVFLLILIGSCHVVFRFLKLVGVFIRRQDSRFSSPVLTRPEAPVPSIPASEPPTPVPDATESEMSRLLNVQTPHPYPSPEAKEAIRLLKKAYPSIPDEQRREITQFIHRVRAQESLYNRFPAFKIEKNDN